MEKRSYVKPVLSGEEFVPQNYIAACGDTGATYKFTCDATGGITGTVVLDTDGDGVREDSDETITGYGACSKTHEAPTTDQYYDGWYRIITWEGIKWIPVKIWRGEDGNNCHVTKEVDMTKWEIAKS